MRPKRLAQAASLAIFSALVVCASESLVCGVAARWFLGMDPAGVVQVASAERDMPAGYVPALCVLALTLLAGRFFCSMVCPLGALVDVTDSVFGAQGRVARPKTAGMRGGKYLVLGILAASAAFGLALAAFLSPLSIMARLVGLVLHPLGMDAAGAFVRAARPLAEDLGMTRIAYAAVTPRDYGLEALSAGVAGIALAGVVLGPRFWCRCLCPAGAVFALFSVRPLLVRRRVNEGCTSCMRCVERCPMLAIGPDPRKTDHAECIACMRCARVCPVSAVGFLPGGGRTQGRGAGFSRSRRFVLLGVLFAAASGAVLARFLNPVGLGGSRVARAGFGVLRPPGSVPGGGFELRCVGCGLCMTVCPTNILRPSGALAGAGAAFSPTVDFSSGPCDTSCTSCTQVCPTGAIRPLSPAEKKTVKVGTARIDTTTCIAWASAKACLVCDEVCPVGAVELRREPHAALAVPVVREDLCIGCGYCEHHCPVRPERAIVVTADGAGLRVEGLGLGGAEKKVDGGIGGQGGDEALPGGKLLPPGFSD